MVPTLVTRPGSKVLDDTPFDDDANLLNFVMAVSWMACWTSCQLQNYWFDPEKLDDLIFTLRDTGPAFPVLSHEYVKSGL
jgi:hypothetical protein